MTEKVLKTLKALNIRILLITHKGKTIYTSDELLKCEEAPKAQLIVYENIVKNIKANPNRNIKHGLTGNEINTIRKAGTSISSLMNEEYLFNVPEAVRWSLNGEDFHQQIPLLKPPEKMHYGMALEVMVKISHDKYPYFVYYANEEYYMGVTLGTPFKGKDPSFQNFSKYRELAARSITRFLIRFLFNSKKISFLQTLRTPYSHNYANTTVITYIHRLKSWIPLRCPEGMEDDLDEHIKDIENNNATPNVSLLALTERSTNRNNNLKIPPEVLALIKGK